MVSVLGINIDLVPIFHIPLARRLQTLVVLIYTLLFLMPLAVCLLWLVVLFSPFAWLALGYLGWILYDYNVNRVSARGGRRWPRLRQAAFWRYMRDFFPVSLVKTAPLDPANNYLMGYHPHGILGCGAFCNFSTEATGFSDLYPGIRPTMLTLNANFLWPLLRGFLLWMGACDVSKESINWILSKQGPGNAAVIVIGGAEESLEAHPGNYNITLKHRKGFVKMAIRNGAHLVPMFSFGELDLFHQADNPRGSWIRKFQETFKKVFGFAPPLFYGRGILNYNFGLIPFRKPICTVVGAPIPIEKCSDPDQDTIDKLHQQYMDQLDALFDKHKTTYGIDADKKVNFI